RRHIAAIYAYARTADDFADEIADPVRARAALDDWDRQLRACYAGAPRGPIFIALAATVRTFRIPIEPFLNLLTAFRADVDFARRAVTPQFRELMRFECERARALFDRGLPLADMLPRGLGREVRLFALGGLAILDRLAEAGYDAFTARPTLSRWAKAGLVMR